MADPTRNGVKDLPPPSGELMRSALAEFRSKSLPDRLRMLQAIGILDRNGDLAPDYSDTHGEVAESAEDRDQGSSSSALKP